MDNVDKRMQQDILATLEQCKRREGRLFGAFHKHGNHVEATKCLARYNNLENQIAYFADKYGLKRRWAAHKLDLEVLQ